MEEAAPAPTAPAPAKPVRGLPASRRAWKKPAKERASAMTRPAAAQNKSSISRFNVQKAYRKALEVAKVAEKQRAEEIASKKQDLKRKREEKAKRRAENELKSSSYQVVRGGPGPVPTPPPPTAPAPAPADQEPGEIEADEQEAAAAREEDARERARRGGVCGRVRMTRFQAGRPGGARTWGTTSGHTGGGRAWRGRDEGRGWPHSHHHTPNRAVVPPRGLVVGR